MKNFICLLVVIFSIGLGDLHAQSPQSISYQLIVRYSLGQAMNSQPIDLRVSILQGAANGSIIYQESHTTSTNSYGLVNLEIGTGSVNMGLFDTIPWGDGPFFAETSIDFNSSGNYQTISNSQFLSVPYALYAERAWSSTIDTAAILSLIQSNGSGGMRYIRPNRFWDFVPINTIDTITIDVDSILGFTPEVIQIRYNIQTRGQFGRPFMRISLNDWHGHLYTSPFEILEVGSTGGSWNTTNQYLHGEFQLPVNQTTGETEFFIQLEFAYGRFDIVGYQ